MRLSVSYEELWRSISIILHMVRKPNSIILLLFIQNNSQFKNIAKTSLPSSMLSSSSIAHVQGCSAPQIQIFSKQQMSPFELSSCCSCHVFSYYFAQFERTKFHIIRKTHQILRRQCCCFMNSINNELGLQYPKSLIVSECLLALQLRQAICLKTANFQVEISHDQYQNLLWSFSAKTKSYLTN